jgi:hypothetical protein
MFGLTVLSELGTLLIGVVPLVLLTNDGSLFWWVTALRGFISLANGLAFTCSFGKPIGTKKMVEILCNCPALYTLHFSLNIPNCL